MNKKLFLFVLLPVLLAACQGDSSLQVDKPTVESRQNPDGIGTTQPRFSWQLASPLNDVMQAAYQIEVAASETGLKHGRDLLWNTGRVESDQSLFIPYAGKPLQSGTRYYWQVTVWDNHGGKARSGVQTWSTALFNASDWQAQWIGLDGADELRLNGTRTILPARYLRKEFTLDGKPVRAMLYVSGLGASVCYLNGQRVGDDVFGTIPTWYDASVPYLTYDVTDALIQGANAIGVVLGNGRFFPMRSGNNEWMPNFGYPRLLAQLQVEYADGKVETIVSDPTWQATSRGPITENNEFDGEHYDARLELGAWTRPGYDASAWQPAERMDAPKGKLVAQLSPSLKVHETIKPVSVKSVGEGRYIVDMGQNMVGIQQVRLQGKAGKPISMRFAEVLKDNGTELYLDNLRSALVTDVYTPARDGEFTWQPLFVYHGFRFMEVSGLDYAPTVDDFAGLVVYDGMETTGRFATSNDLLNRIHRNAYWGIRGNYRGMPTDCPQRDERQGWLGDRTMGAYGESFLFGNSLLYYKWLVDIEESMSPEGSISDVSPRYWTLYNDDVTWPAAYFYVADMLYRQFGDDRSIRERYPSMKRWVEYITEKKMHGYIMETDAYGDWCMPPESPELIHSQDPARRTDGHLLSTAVFHSILELMQQFATMNGLPADAREYADLAAKIKQAYNDRFFDPETARYSNNTVTANLISLRLGLVPEGYEDRVYENIVTKTETVHESHVSAGVLGIQHLMRGLTERGNADLAYRIATQTTYPSWGYMIEKGATTIWELWNGDTANPEMNSHNHVMLLGDLLIWMYEDLAGIQCAPDATAFKHVWMEPAFPDGLNEVMASHESPYGEISSHWKRTGDRLEWHITLPPNTTATVQLPAKFNVAPQADAKGIHAITHADGHTTIELGSGNYTLSSK